VSAAAHANGYASREPVKPVPWHELVVWDMLANGMTTGLFLVAVLCEFLRPAEFGPVTRFAYPLALVLLTIDLVLLVLDLGDPLRFHHMLRVFKPSSPMSLGVWSLTAYSFPLGVAAVLGFLPESALVETVRKTALVLGIVPAFLSAVYKGVLLSTSSQPGWRNARWLGASHTTGAISLGAAQMIVLALVMQRPETAAHLRWLLLAALVVHFVPGMLVLRELTPAAKRGHGPAIVYLGGVALLGGVLVPAALAIIPAMPLWVPAALVLAGNLLARWLLVRLPHPAHS
jgi:formate-dependent nitrite reductase membrane component NrfD